jgi:hypothetical protein
MIIDFSKFIDGLSKCELSNIQQDCLQASSRCPQSIASRDCPEKMTEEVLYYWCYNEVLFDAKYAKHLSKTTLETLLLYRAYLEVVMISEPNYKYKLK